MSSPEDRLGFVRALNSPNLLDTDFPEDESDRVELPPVSQEEADAFFESLEPRPEEDKPKIGRIIQRALDQIKIESSRSKPTNN